VSEKGKFGCGGQIWVRWANLGSEAKIWGMAQIWGDEANKL